ncbi:MAG: 4-carboxy-4-hydroxy-2-oxoadipate aldolase/oxaloacetate decarboxylase [Spirochaetaceae bacterium]|nr:MAG: 4-carboxy-4-hydroxy-2-oxoadipate aldolase/oxaloacetate decarboxylase [Spirochaetaceae bacterium]
MVHVYTKVPRPDRKLVEAFKDLGAATVYEAAGRMGSVDPRIKPLARGFRLLGPAFTVECHPKDNLMLHKALQIAEKGDVLVASTQGYSEAGYWGGLMSGSAAARQLGGLAIDGCVRDSAELLELGFPVFCRGTCIRGTTKGILGRVNHPIVFGEVVVNPGDLVLGDDDGLVIIPQTDIETVLKASQERVAKEVKKASELTKGVSSVELNKLEPVFRSLGLVEE